MYSPLCISLRASLQVATDSLFHCANRNATLAGPVSRKSPVFMYRFDHIMSFSDVAWANFSYCDDKVRCGCSRFVLAGSSS